MRKLIILLMMLVFAACKQLPDVPTVISPYRIDIQQGNVVTQEMIAKLKPGMARSQVRFALGSPLIVDPFRTDRWDYVYMFQKQGKETERRNIAVIFDDDKLVRIEGDVTALQPAAKPAEPAAVKPPVAAKPAVKPATEKPATAKPAAGTAQPDAAKADRTAAGEKEVRTDAAKADAAKSAPPPAKADAGKDKPKEERGFFGRMMDKIGF